MIGRPAHSRRHMLDGAFWGLLAEALIVPTGLATIIFLTRTMGPDGYGSYAVVMTIVTWMEFAIVAMFSRTTVKLVSGAEAWQPAAAALVRITLAMGLMLCTVLWMAADLCLASILTGALVSLSIAGYVIAIPLLAGTGAAIAAVTTCLFGGLVLSAAVYQQSGIRPDGLTILRSSIVCAAVYVLAVYWPAPGPLVLLKLTALGLLVPLLFVGVGELSIRQMLSFVQSHRRPAAQLSEAQDAA